MKVLKNNFNEVTTITTCELQPYPRTLECENCSSELEYEKSDLEVGVYGAMHVKCPLCGYANMLDGNENDVELTKDNIEFPTHFHHTSTETGAVNVCDNEHIKKEINRAIEYFRTHKDEWHWYTEYGNLYISVDRYDGDESYEVVVTDNYYSTYIPFEGRDY